MSLKDIRTLRAIAKELSRYLDSHIKTDHQFFINLRRYTFVKGRADRLQAHCEKIHKRIRKDLEEAIHLSARAERRVEKGKEPKKELNAILPYLDSFTELLFSSKHGLRVRFGLKSEYDALMDLRNELQKEGFDNSILTLIGERIQKMYGVTSEQRFKELVRLKKEVSHGVGSYFKVKRNMISFNRPKVRESFHIGHSRAHLEIFFSKALTDERMASLVEHYENVLSNRIGVYLTHNNSHMLERVKRRIDKKGHALRGKSIHSIQKEWLENLKQVCMDTLEHNTDLVLTPAFRLQLRIDDDSGTLASCDPYSRLDHYLVRMSISLIIIIHLISEEIQESFPLSLISQLDECVRPQKPGSSKTASDDGGVNKALTQIMRSLGAYRTVSLPTILAHELQHAVDKKWFVWFERVWPMLNHLMREAHLYSEGNSLNLGPGMLQLARFYMECRREAPAQLKEFITSYGKAMQQQEIYTLVNPVPSIGYRDAIQEMNTLIWELEKDPSQTPYTASIVYDFSHLMNLTIFLADCKRKGMDLVLLDQASLHALYRAFPRAAPALFGYSGMSRVTEGSPDWFLLKSVSEGDDTQFTRILGKQGIKWYTLNHFTSLIEGNASFYIFKPPLQAMRETLKKIQHSYEVTYMDMYEKACDVLRIHENNRLLSIRKVKALAEELFKAHERIVRGVGFNP